MHTFSYRFSCISLYRKCLCHIFLESISEFFVLQFIFIFTPLGFEPRTFASGTDALTN